MSSVQVGRLISKVKSQEFLYSSFIHSINGISHIAGDIFSNEREQ